MLFRLEVLSFLNALVKEWIKDTSRAQNIPENIGGLVCTFGSFRIGVYHKGADIDTVVIVPRHINRSDFFTSFYQKLKTQSFITNVRVSPYIYIEK